MYDPSFLRKGNAGGAVAEINTVWLIADCFNALMALPNLIALIALSGMIVKITQDHFNTKDE